jgi:hypothetical protein
VSDDDFNGPADRCSDLVDAMLQEGHDPGALPQAMVAASGLHTVAYSTAEPKEEAVR